MPSTGACGPNFRPNLSLRSRLLTCLVGSCKPWENLALCSGGNLANLARLSSYSRLLYPYSGSSTIPSYKSFGCINPPVAMPSCIGCCLPKFGSIGSSRPCLAIDKAAALASFLPDSISASNVFGVGNVPATIPLSSSPNFWENMSRNLSSWAESLNWVIGSFCLILGSQILLVWCNQAA